MSNVEHPKYKVSEHSGNIEIRDYAPMIVAEAEVKGDRREAISKGFRRPGQASWRRSSRARHTSRETASRGRADHYPPTGVELRLAESHWSCQTGTTMADSIGLIVEMIDDQIIVTMPGTLFLAAYRKRENMAALVTKFIRDDRHAAIPRSEFVARSWRLALATARQLGWIAD
jgi:hypothetical protein